MESLITEDCSRICVYTKGVGLLILSWIVLSLCGIHVMIYDLYEIDVRELIERSRGI